MHVATQRINVGMYTGCDYSYKSYLYTFWPCYSYFILQFYYNNIICLSKVRTVIMQFIPLLYIIIIITVNREYFVPKIFDAINFHVK